MSTKPRKRALSRAEESRSRSRTNAVGKRHRRQLAARKDSRRRTSQPASLSSETDMPAIVSVELLWSENRAVPKRTFPSLALADAALAHAFAVSPPPAGGAYDKTAFVVAWSDGKRHEGRVDVRAIDVQTAPSAGGILRQHLLTVGAAMRDARRSKFLWLSVEQERAYNEWGSELLRRLAHESASTGPRNGRASHRSIATTRMTFRSVGARGEPYPAWVQELRGRSGAYIIRERQPDASMSIVYVGESHTDRLHETLTRHFQAWRRFKGFWRGQYAEGHDPGLTYNRDTADAAVVVTLPEQALEMEAQLIRRLHPRDNLLGQEKDQVPF